jgi:hypothetical protein
MQIQQKLTELWHFSGFVREYFSADWLSMFGDFASVCQEYPAD